MAHFKVPCDGWIVHLLPFVITLTALILSAGGTLSCRFLSSNSETVGQNFFGIFAYQVSPDVPCVNINFRYDQFKLDKLNETPESFAVSENEFVVAQILAIISTSAGAQATLLLFISFFQRFPPRCFRFMLSLTLLIAFACACGTFRLFNIFWCGGEGEFFDEGTGEFRDIFSRCFVEDGGMRMAAAAALYVLAAIFVCLMKPPHFPMIAFSREYGEVPISEEGTSETDELEMLVPTPVVEEEQKVQIAAPEEPSTHSHKADEMHDVSNKNAKETEPKPAKSLKCAKSIESDQISAVCDHNVDEFDKM